MSTAEHREQAKNLPVTCAVLTISDTRTEETDKSGRFILDQLTAAGHTIAAYHILPDEPDQIRTLVESLAPTIEVILTNGGTGISKRDNTYEALAGLVEKTLPGFGEIFRVFSYDEVGPAAMLSRAMCGIYRQTVIFAMPGSTNAVKLAMNKLILPELQHLVWELIRK